MPPYLDFVILDVSWGNQENQNLPRILNSTARTSYPHRVGRSTFTTSSSKEENGMRNLLGNYVIRSFLLLLGQQGSLDLSEHELLAAVVVSFFFAIASIVSSDSSPRRIRLT